jgi:hypothetical protein
VCDEKKLYVSVKEEVVMQIIEFLTAKKPPSKFLLTKIHVPSVRVKMETKTSCSSDGSGAKKKVGEVATISSTKQVLTVSPQSVYKMILENSDDGI